MPTPDQRADEIKGVITAWMQDCVIGQAEPVPVIDFTGYGVGRIGHVEGSDYPPGGPNRERLKYKVALELPSHVRPEQAVARINSGESIIDLDERLTAADCLKPDTSPIKVDEDQDEESGVVTLSFELLIALRSR